MKKWQIEPIRSIGGASPRKVVFTGHDIYLRPELLNLEPKKDSLFVARIRRVVDRITRYL